MKILRLLGVFVACGLFVVQADAMVFFKRNGVMIIHSAYASGDEARLKEALTPDVKTVILRGPSGGDVSRGLELAALIDHAGVKTVVHGTCAGLVCPMMFLAGKERVFSGETRAEASYLRLPMGQGFLPETAGEDRGQSWEAVTDFWRSHTRLSRKQTTPQNAPLLQVGTQPTESEIFFHPSARTSQGSVMHCAGERQSVPYCVAEPEGDALQLGVITSAELFRNVDVLRERSDLARPTVQEGDIQTPPGQYVSDACRKLYAEFLRYDAPRAFVVSFSGGCYSRGAQSIRPYAEAMAACAKGSPGRVCRFYTVDDDFVFVDFEQALPEMSAGK